MVMAQATRGCQTLVFQVDAGRDTRYHAGHLNNARGEGQGDSLSQFFSPLPGFAGSPPSSEGAECRVELGKHHIGEGAPSVRAETLKSQVDELGFVGLEVGIQRVQNADAGV